jgi:glycerate kinase
MKIIIAPDSFKGTMSAEYVATTIATEYKKIFPTAEIIKLPMADGGEGTTDAIISSTNGEKIKCDVCGPLGNTVTAEYGLINDGKTAVMEMASASGIELVPVEQLNPMIATTYGTGELITDALSRGVSEILIGIGGSATVDGDWNGSSVRI